MSSWQVAQTSVCVARGAAQPGISEYSESQIEVCGTEEFEGAQILQEGAGRGKNFRTEGFGLGFLDFGS